MCFPRGASFVAEKWELLWKAARSFLGRSGWSRTRRWGGFVRKVRWDIFTSTELQVLIDNLFSYFPVSVIRAHLNCMTTRTFWTGVPSYFRPSHKEHVQLPFVYGLWSMMAWAWHRSGWLRLGDSACSDPLRPAGSHGSWPQFALMPSEVNTLRVKQGKRDTTSSMISLKIDQ